MLKRRREFLPRGISRIQFSMLLSSELRTPRSAVGIVLATPVRDAERSVYRTRDYPSVVYFHGNAGTRGNSHRIRVARMISDEQHNFVLIDYR